MAETINGFIRLTILIRTTILAANLQNPLAQTINIQLHLHPMKRHLFSARDLIISIVDFFYPLFRRFMDLQTFRYAACGGANTVLGLIVYYISYKFILKEQILDLGFYAFEAHSAALFISFLINFPMGFFLMKFIVFTESNMRGRVQLFRYFMVFVSSLVLNYFCLKFFVEYLHIFVMLSQIMTTVIIILFSYLFQKHFTFKVKFHNEEVTKN